MHSYVAAGELTLHIHSIVFDAVIFLQTLSHLKGTIIAGDHEPGYVFLESAFIFVRFLKNFCKTYNMMVHGNVPDGSCSDIYGRRD